MKPTQDVQTHYSIKHSFKLSNCRKKEITSWFMYMFSACTSYIFIRNCGKLEFIPPMCHSFTCFQWLLSEGLQESRKWSSVSVGNVTAMAWGILPYGICSWAVMVSAFCSQLLTFSSSCIWNVCLNISFQRCSPCSDFTVPPLRMSLPASSWHSK